MKSRPRWSTVAVALALTTALAFASPVLGGPSLKKLVKNEVAKQIGKATGPAGPAGPAGLAGANGTARAFAYLDTGNCVVQMGDDPCPLQHEKGITAARRTSTGEYCLTAPGINGAATPAAITPEYSGTSLSNGEGNASAMQDITSSCGSQDFDVLTFFYPSVSVRNAAGTGATTVVGQAIQTDEVAFTIVIP